MNESDTNALLDEITRFYLESRDFNGIPAPLLTHKLNVTNDQLAERLVPLVTQGFVSVVFGDIHPNPHIRALPDELVGNQLAKLPTDLLNQACIYPLLPHLRNIVNPQEYRGRPYTLSLALGTPQLEFKPFNLSVLEYYRNEPRYSYHTDNIRGSIGVRDAHFGSQEMAESDQVLLQTFGFAYDSDQNRAIAVFVRYLSDLTPEHQQIWRAKELTGKCYLHPDYYRTTILGDWGEKISIFDAFLEELQVVNKMAEAMSRSHLFKNDFSKADPPPEFSFLVRPTTKELNDFILLLDKMISGNINLDFFDNEVSYEREETKQDGKTIVHPLGTIAILEEWLHRRFRTDDWEPCNKMITTFKDIRRKRQRPAHAIDENVFDQKYFHQQRELIIKAYESIRTLRLVLWNFPGCADIEMNELVREGKIWTY